MSSETVKHDRSFMFWDVDTLREWIDAGLDGKRIAFVAGDVRYLLRNINYDLSVSAIRDDGKADWYAVPNDTKWEFTEPEE